MSVRRGLGGRQERCLAGRIVAKPDQEILSTPLFIEVAKKPDRVGAMASKDDPEQRKHLRPDAPTRQRFVGGTEFLFLEGGDWRKEVLDPGRFLSYS
jgi:hypothetical protein